MLKSELLVAIQREIQSHDFSHFIDEPPSIAEGGKGVVVPGCPRCRVRFHTTSQFLDHLANGPAGTNFSAASALSVVSQLTHLLLRILPVQRGDARAYSATFIILRLR